MLEVPVLLDRKNCIRREVRTSSKGSQYYMYVFPCGRCGKEMVVYSGNISRHSGNCIQCFKPTLIHRKSYNTLRNNRRKIPVDISYEDFCSLCLESDCHYCEKFLDRTLEKGQNKGYYLDRKDNSLGYSKKNCVPCCSSCNKIKGDSLTYEEMLVAMKAVLSYRQSKTKILRTS